MKIRVNDVISLDEFTLDDKFDLVNHLNDKEVSDTMLTIPFPYTLQDAENWIYFTLNLRASGKQPQSFAIRLHVTGEVIGGIGLNLKEEKFYRHQAEIGYWVAKKYWNKGIITDAIKTFSNLAFNLYPFLEKLTALVFIHNIGSQKVLEKNGFKEEGLLRKHIRKNDEFYDCKAYGLLKGELFNNEKHDLA